MNSEAIINLSEVKIYQNDIIVLANVNLKINRGEFVYLIGKTGSGKSSLLKTLYAEIPLLDGSGTVAGFNLMKLKRSKIPQLRRKLGIVFQDFQLLSDRDVLENLLFVLKATGWKNKKEMKARAEEVLQKVGMEFKGHKFPHQLSGGEQQRIAIARALLNEPDLILADEPTGNLDPETSHDIMKLLIEISQNGKAILMATHDYQLMQTFPMRTIKCEDETVKDSALV
jgi:cell division transport system ATP-binding protein